MSHDELRPDLTEDMQLIHDVIGPAATLRLMEELPGMRPYIQSADRLILRAKTKKAARLLQQGLPIREIAAKVDLPIYQVRRLVASRRAA